MRTRPYRPQTNGSDPETADLIEDAIDQLADEGAALARPLADRVKRREAVFLVAGDKAGNWEAGIARPSRSQTKGLPSTSLSLRQRNKARDE
jgi:hypothetical protein